VILHKLSPSSAAMERWLCPWFRRWTSSQRKLITSISDGVSNSRRNPSTRAVSGAWWSSSDNSLRRSRVFLCIETLQTDPWLNVKLFSAARSASAPE
jgi:hypothetical protein